MPARNNATGYGAVFANTAFMALLIAQLISYLGDRLDPFTLLQLARKGDEAPPDEVMTAMAMALILPFVLLAPLVGPVVDRFSRKGVLIVTSLCQGVIILSIPFLRPFGFVQEHALLTIYLTIFLIGAFTAFFTPAKTSMIAEIVERPALMAANSLTTFAGTIMNMLGALVAFWMLHLNEAGRISLNACFYIDAGTYFISCAMIAAIVVPKSPEVLLLREQRARAREPFTRQLASALAYLRGHRRPLKLVMLAGTFGCVAGSVYAMTNAKILNEMGAETSTYAVLMGVFGLALMAGGLAMALWHRRLPSYEGFAAAAYLLVAACIYWLAVAGNVWVELPAGALEWARRMNLAVEEGALGIPTALLPLIAIGAVGGALMVFITTMIQKSVPKRYHGRVFALNNLIYNLFLIVGLGVGIALQKQVGAGRMSLEAASIGVAAIALLMAAGVVAANERLWFRCLWLVVWPLFRLFFRVEVEGRENVPTHGAVIVAANHSSWFDTVFVGLAVPRVVHYLIDRGWHRRWYMRPVVKAFAAIPVPEDGGKTGAMRTAIDALRRGRALGVVPEGHLTRDGKLRKHSSGVGFIAAQTDTPILPLAIVGAYEIFPRHRKLPRPGKALIRIGEPIYPAGRERHEIADEVMARIAEMKELRRVKSEG